MDGLDNSITEDVITCYVALGTDAVEIDLGAENREELETFLSKYFEAGRPVKPGKPARPARPKQSPPTSRSDRDRTHDVRQWAIDNGYTVSARGRISKEVQDAYANAH
jgi:hypothetical protein